MRDEEIRQDYEHHTGVVIAECFRQRRFDPLETPAVLVAGHGPFAWGSGTKSAVENAIVLEEVARMALNTFILNGAARPIEKALLEKHFFRKHGPGSTYGQQDD